MTRQPVFGTSLLLLCIGLAGCGGATATSMDADAGPSDATVDADPGDASEDALVGDAGTDADGGTGPDGGESMFQCPMVGDGMLLELPASQTIPPVVATALVESTMHLVYAAEPCTMGARDGQGLRALRVPSSGEIPEPVDVANAGGGCFETLAPSVVALSPERAHAYFTATNTAYPELYLQPLEPGPEEDPPGLRLSFDDEDVRLREYLTSATRIDATDVLAFAAEHRSAGERGLFTLRPATSDPAIEVLALSEQHRPIALAAAALYEGEADAVLAWVGESAGVEGVHLQPLDERGAPVGEARTLPASIGNGAALDIAAREDGAAVAYTEGASSSEIRLLLLNENGLPQRDPIGITFGNESATDVGIAPYSTGYVLAFRSLTGNGTGGPVIRLAFVDVQGLVAGFRNVAPATESGGRVGVEVGLDGRIMLAWPDVTADGVRVRVARLECT